jgi:hypothetical protein
MRLVADPEVRRQRLATGQRRGIAVVARDVDDGDALDEPGQRLGDDGVEPPDGLRPAEDEQHPDAVGDGQPPSGRLPVHLACIADGRAGHEARSSGRRRGQGRAGRRERDGQDVGQSRGHADGATGDDVAIPQDDRDAERRGRQEDRDGDVATGREDRRRPFGGQDRAGLGDGRGQSDRVEDGMDVAVDRPQRAQGQPAQRDPRGRDDARLQTAVAAQPAEVNAVRSNAQRPGDGQRRVDVPARPAARDEQSHPGSTSPFRWSPVRSTGGSRRPRS